MKEELLKKAMELVAKCRICYQNFEKAKKENASVGLRLSLFVSFVQSYWHYIGFCEALIKASIFDLKDVDRIHKIVFLDLDAAKEELGTFGVPSSEIVNFINGLQSIDNI